METDCNTEYDGSPDVSVEEEEEDEEGPQEQQLTHSSLKKLNQNEEVKSKLSDAMDTVQSEDSGLTWETSSSRCSTSQASETSTTSGFYSMENSFMDCPPGKVIFPMDEEKTTQKRPSSSPDQRPLSPSEKISTDSTKCDFSGEPMQVKAQERELDPSDPHSWPFQVQPSKIKDYLVQITQDTATSLPEEKENTLMRKGELPLKGTVRARIQLITAVLEERHKKIFRRVNRKDLPPPSDVHKKPREQPKIFSRQGISVSLRHIERDATDKNNKKEILRYNLKHVETNISKSGASVPYNKDEKQTRRSFLPETLNKASEKPPPISLLLAEKAKKPDTKLYSPGMQTSVLEQESFAPDCPDKTEKGETQALLAATAKVMPEESSSLLAETERQKMQDYSPVTTVDTDRSEKPKALLQGETVQPCSPVSAEPLYYPVSKPENQSDSMVTVLSETTAQDVHYPNNAAAMQHASEQSLSAETRNQDIEFTVPSQLEIKDAALLHSAEKTGKQAIPLYSPETAQSLPKQAELSPSVSGAEEQEKEQSKVGCSKEEVVQEQLAVCLQAESGHLDVLHSVKEPEPGVTVTDLASTTSSIETQESQSGSYKTAEEHSELLETSYFIDEAEQKGKEHLESEFAKQAAPAQDSVTTSLEPKHPDVSHSRGLGENQTVQPETQHPDLSLPIAEAHREETHSNSRAIAHPESEHPIISEPIKALQGSEPLEPSHLKTQVKQDFPFEEHSELPPPSYFTGEAHQKGKEHLESEFAKQSAQTQLSVTESLKPKHPDVSHSRGQGEIQTTQPETQHPNSSLPIADVHREETHSDSSAIAESESEHPVMSEPIKAPQGSELLEPSHLKTQVKQDFPVEKHSELPPPSYFTGEAHQKGKEHLESEFAKQSAQTQLSVTESLKPKHPDVSHSRGQGEIQTTQPETQHPNSSLPIADVHREETHSDSSAIAESESEHPVMSEPIKAPQGSEPLEPSHLKTQVKQDFPVEKHSELPPPSYFTGEAHQKGKEHLESEFAKQSAQTRLSVTKSLKPKHPDVSHSRGLGENQTVQPETQHPDLSLPIAEAHREETHSNSRAIAHPESEHPIISEPIKALQGSEPLEPSHLKTQVKQDFPVEKHSELPPPSYFTGEAHQKGKKHLESEFAKQSAQTQLSVTESLKPKHPDVSHSRGQGEIQTTQPETQHPNSSLPIADVHREETHSDSSAIAESESEHPVMSEPIKAPQGSELLEPSHLKTQVKQDFPVEKHSELPPPSYFTGEAHQKGKEHLESEFAKQSAQTQLSVTESLKPKHPDVSHSRGQGEIQTTQPETQHPNSSLPIADVHREETHSDSSAIAESESEHPVMSEPIKAPQGSEPLEPSHLKTQVKQDFPVEKHSELPPPSYFTGEAHQKGKEHLESEFAKQSAQTRLSVTKSLKPKHPDVSHSRGLGENQTVQPETQHPDLSLPIAEAHREETHSNSRAIAHPESEHPIISEPIKAPQGSELLEPSHLKTQVKQDFPVEKHSELPPPSYFTGEAHQKGKEHLESEFAKQSAQTQLSVTESLKPKHPDVSHSRGQGEIQTTQPETQHPNSSLPIADVHREETHSDSSAIAESESEHPVMSEPIKAPQGSEPLEPSHLKTQVKQDFPVEKHSELPPPSYFTGEAHQKGKEHLESEFAKQSAQTRLSVTKSLKPKHPDVSHSRGLGENQTVQPETQHPDLSLPIAEAHREETHSNSRAIAHPESEHPIISEPIKALQGSEPLEPLHLKTQVKQDFPVEKHSELPPPSYFTGEAHQKGKKHLESEFAKQSAQTQDSVTESLKPKHPDVSHSRGQGEIQTAQPETQHPNSSLPIADVHREETHSDSSAIPQSESEHPVISEPIKAPQGSEPLEPSHRRGKEENQYSPAEALNLSEPLPSISSLLTETIEKQKTELSSLVTTAPLSKQPHSVLPCPAEQMTKQEKLPQPPEIGASHTTVAFQNVEVTEVEFQPLLSTEDSSEESLLFSREPDVTMERKTTQLVSALPGEPPSETSVLSQEEVRLENQLYPSINAKLCSEDQDESHPNINEGQQEGWLELDHLVESQSRKQTMKQNSSVPSQLEETIALHSVDEGDKNDRHPDKPIAEPRHPDPLQPVCVLEKQERAQTAIEKTAQQFSPTLLPMEADTFQSTEEAEINGVTPHLPATAQNLSNSVYLMGTQEKQCVLTGTTTLDSAPSTTAKAEKYNTIEPESKHMEKQSIHAVLAELEPDYPNVSHSLSEAGKPLDITFPAPSTEERDFQSHRSVTPKSEDKGPISSERKQEEARLYSLVTLTSELECPTAAPETQGSQKDSFDSSLNEASKPSPVMVTFVPDEIKHQAVAAESTVSSVLASEQTNFLSPEVKDKAEIEGSQFPFPAETPKMVPEDSPSFTTFPIGEAREEPLYSPMAPKFGPEESNSIPEDFVSVEVKEMAPPVSLLPTELLSPETISLYPPAVGEKQDQSKHTTMQTMQAETAKLEPDFPIVSHSGSESGKLLDASSPVPSTEEGNLQSHLPVTPEWEGEHPVSSEREKEESGLYPLITPTSKVECSTAAPETQGSQNDSFDHSLNEASKPSPIMVSFVPDEINYQTVATESIVSSVLASEQTNFRSPELKDKAEIEGSQLPFPAQTPKMVPVDSPPFTTFPIGEAREELLYSPMAPKIVPEESNSIPEDVVSEEVKEIPPATSLYAAVEEKQDQFHSFLKEESRSLAAGKADMQDAQFNLLITAQSEMRSQDIQLYCPATTQPELEDLSLLNSTEEIRKQEPPLYSPSALPSASIHQELLGHKGERETQERITLEDEHPKEHDAPLKSSIMQQELEHLNLLQSVKESPIEGIQSYSCINVQDSPQVADETGRQQHQDYLFQTAEVGSGVSVLSKLMDEAKKQDLPPPLSEVAQLECKHPVLSTEERGEVQHPLDLGHLGLSYSTETQFSSSGAQNQTSKQPPSISSLLTEKVEEQDVKSHSAAALMSSSVLSPSTSALLDLMEEDEKQKKQDCSPEVANVMPEEPLSIAAFLLSEAKTIHATFPLTSETENLDAQSSFKEAGLLIKRSGSASALPPERNVMIKREDEPSTTLFESEQFASKPQADVISSRPLEDIRENIPDIPTLPNVILNEPSNALISEPINDTHTHNLHSSESSEDSNTTVNKAIAISAEDLVKTEDERCLANVERALKEPENYLQKEKDLKDYEKQRTGSIPAPELDQGNDTFAISEGYKEANIHAPPLISPVDKEDKHVLESLGYLETVPVLKAKLFDEVEDVILDHEPSVCKLSGKTSEGLKADNRENKGNESKELVKEKGVQENVETTTEVSFVPENMGDGILNATHIDHIEKYTLMDDASFTQTGKEQPIKDVQGPFDVTTENSEEGTSPAASSENILEFSLLERDFDKAKKENTHEDTSKILNEAEAVRGNYENIEDELNSVGAGAPLFNPEKDELSQSPLFPLPVTAVNPELLKEPALEFLYKDFYEERVRETKEDSSKCQSSEETDIPFHTRGHASDEGSEIYFEKDIPDNCAPNNLEKSQKEKVLKVQPINEQDLNQTRVSEIKREPSEKVHKPIHILAEANAPRGVLSPSGVVESLSDTLTERSTEIVSDIKVGICQPTHAIPFGSGLYSSGASNDDSSQRREEECLSEETDQALPEETSDEESSPILDYAATVYQNEALVQNESQDIACLAVDQNQQSEITEVHEVNNYVVRKPVEESTHSLEAFQHVDSHWQCEGQPEGKLMAAFDEPMAQDAHPLDHEHLPYWDTERETSEKSIGENIAQDLTERNIETTDHLEPEAIKDKPFVELDYSLLSHDFDTYPLYSIKEEDYSDIDEDLAELMDYEMVERDDVFQEETSSEAAREELLFDDRKSLDHISDSYEFVNEREASMYAEEEEYELMDSGKPPRNVPETEILQKEIEQADLDTYCYQCKCSISGEDKFSGEHKEHDVTDLDTAVALLKGQLNGFLDVLQERSLKIEGFVSEIEALFNSLEENCKEKEQLLEEQNESIVKMVMGHHDRKAQSFEEIKNTKMEYLYEQMVNFQEYIDTAKDILETIIKETEEMDDFVFLKSSEEINKRLLSAMENILTLEKMPAAFSQFEHYASGSANGEQTLKHMPVPQTPKLQPQDPSSATSTSIAVYWTVNEDDVIDFFQVYCMEEYPGSKEQSGLVEEYRVTVKESNCILEDLEPGHSYSVWVMAVNHTGCSFPSDKSTFRTAPPTPVIKAEECTVCWDTATIRWSTGHPDATDSFTLEYCRQYSPEGEGLRSLAGIKRPEMKVHLESNVNYFFYVRAVNTFGMSEQSEAALISTKGTRFHIMKGTAHPALQVSPNGTMICLPEDSKFAGTPPVLGELVSARGRHYWETTVSGCAAYKVGICYSPARPDSVLGQNNVSWCLHCLSKTSFVCKVLHNGEMSDVIVTEQPARIGILLDYNTGRLLFFNAERGQVLSAIRHKFTEAAHPAFVLEQPGVLNLHTGMELPEFVEQS